MHSTLYRDLERCIKAATLDGAESAQEGEEQEGEPSCYSTIAWQLERLRTAINGMMRASMGEEEGAEGELFDCGKIELNAECLRTLITAVNSCDDEESGCTVEVPRKERTSTIHALLYELWQTLGSGVLVNGKRYGGYFTTAYGKASNGDTLIVCGDNIQPQASGRMEWDKAVTVIGNGTIVNSAERFGRVAAAVTIGGNVTLDGLNTYGGFVIDSGGALTLTGNATLKDCKEASYGAGIVVNSGGSFTLSGNAVISGCSCTEQNKGGGVTVNQGAIKCDLLGGEITGNSAPHGGGVFVDRAPLNLGGECRIHGNTATTSDGSEGIYVVINDSYQNTYTPPVEDGCTDGIVLSYQNASGGTGGYDYIDSNGAIQRFADFVGALTQATASGGTIVCYKDATLDSSQYITSSVSLVGVATITKSDGVHFYVSDENADFSIGPFITLDGAVQGGGIQMSSGKTTVNGNIKNCKSSSTGGGVYMNGGELTIKSRGNIEKCEATQGGAIYIGAGKCTMDGGIIQDCQASTGTGGAIRVQSGASFTMNGGTIDKCTSANNSSSYLGFGGGIYGGGGTITINGGAITGCECGENSTSGGGAIAIDSGSECTMNGGLLDSNKVPSGCGGGVYVYNGHFTLNGGTISKNEAEYGGGIASWNSSNNVITVAGGEFVENVSSCGQGNAVYINTGSYVVTAESSVRMGSDQDVYYTNS